MTVSGVLLWTSGLLLKGGGRWLVSIFQTERLCSLCDGAQQEGYRGRGLQVHGSFWLQNWCYFYWKVPYTLLYITCTYSLKSPVGLQGARSHVSHPHPESMKVNKGEKMSLRRLKSGKRRGRAVPVYCVTGRLLVAVVGSQFSALCSTLGHFNLSLSALWACAERMEPLPYCPASVSWASLRG